MKARLAVVPLGLFLASCLAPGAEEPSPAASGPDPRRSIEVVVRVPDVSQQARIAPERAVPPIPVDGRPAAAARSEHAVRGSHQAPAGSRSIPAAAESHPIARDPAEAAACVASALNLVRAGQLGIGLAALEAAFAEHPATAGSALATVLHQKALNEYGRGELGRAETLWRRVVAVDPDHPTAASFCAAVRSERSQLGGEAPGRR